MNKLVALLFILSMTLTGFAQHKTLILNYEKSNFGENEPLPSNEHFIISGVVPTEIPYVEVSIFSAKGKDDREPVYSTFWKRELKGNSNKFTVPINRDLREGKEYDVYIKYYTILKGKEKDALSKKMYDALDDYIDQAVKVSGNKLSLEKSENQILKDLGKIVMNTLEPYKSRVLVNFESFSEVSKLKLKQLDGAKIDKPKKGEEQLVASSFDAVKSFKEMMRIELGQYLKTDLYALLDDKHINDYPTEKEQNSLPINIGYGGAVINSDFNDFNYGAAPYLGLSFPFGKEGSESNFWSKTSLSVGAFLGNITDQDNVEYSGPIFKIPPYAALGYRAFRFIRINAGATFLNNVQTSEVSIVPFIGVSAEFNFSISIAK